MPIVCRETGQALDGRDLGISWPQTWHKLLQRGDQAAGLKRQPTPPLEQEDSSAELDSHWDIRSRTPEFDDAHLLVQSQPSFGKHNATSCSYAAHLFC
jgi:hypothetical protein